MAKKSSKSTRRARTSARQQAANKKKPIAKAAVVTAEGSNEPVVKAKKQAPAKKPVAVKKIASSKKAEKPLEVAPRVGAGKIESSASEELIKLARTRMYVGALALVVVIIGLFFGTAIIHRQNVNKQAEMVQSGQDSSSADQILQRGGNVCTNGNSRIDTTGSANPSSVGMMLQSNPANDIQMPQTVGNGADVTTLQGATCF